MKPKPRQPPSGDAKNPPIRASKRIAERKEQSKQADTAKKPLAPKAPPKKSSVVRQKPLGRKKTAAAKTSGKQEAAPKSLKAPRARKVHRPPLVLKALQEHERRTANDPLPEDIAVLKPDYVPPNSDDEEMSTYDPKMPSALTRYRVFDEKWHDEILDLKEPDNMKDILDKITSPRVDTLDEAQCRAEYRDWVETILAPSFSEDMAGGWFPAYLAIPITRLLPPHYKEANKSWCTPSNSTIRGWKPKPDFVEGLIADEVPYWIRNTLKEFIEPDSEIALPNFMAEFKGKGAMKIAHQQVRLDGGVASQGLLKLYSHFKTPEKCLGKALVGSVEYNGEVIIGNVHWAAKSNTVRGGVDYHMRRVMCHFTRGLNFKDFVKNRAEARNFRQLFAEIRENILKELKAAKSPASPAESYDKMTAAQLKDLCRERGLPHNKVKVATMREQLRAYDAGRPIPTMPSESESQITPRNRNTQSIGSQDLRSLALDSPSSRRMRNEDEDDDSAARGQSSKKRKF